MLIRPRRRIQSHLGRLYDKFRIYEENSVEPPGRAGEPGAPARAAASDAGLHKSNVSEGA